MAKRVLGKGLGAIISSTPSFTEEIEQVVVSNADRIFDMDVDQVKANPEQPRTHFDEKAIEELSESIKSVGLIQPIIVRKKDDGYMVIAGERRLRAVKLAGLKKIRTIVIEADEEKQYTMSLIENIQRSDLDPIEEARAYKVLVNRFKLKQNDIADRTGKDRATIANSLRLLNLPDEIQDGLSGGNISVGHAKLLLSVTGAAKQKKLYDEIVEKGLSVRAVEKFLIENGTQERSAGGKKSLKEAHIRKMEESLVSILGTKVEIKHSGSRGRIEISYYSLDDFERIIDLLK